MLHEDDARFLAVGCFCRLAAFPGLSFLARDRLELLKSRETCFLWKQEFVARKDFCRVCFISRAQLAVSLPFAQAHPGVSGSQSRALNAAIPRPRIVPVTSARTFPPHPR